MTNRLVDPLRLERPLAREWPEADDRSYAFRKGGGRKKRAASVWALLAMLVAALVLVPAALADDDDDDGSGGGQAVLVATEPIVGLCTPDSSPQRCDPRSPIAFSGEADSVTFTVSPLHCSSIAVELFINGVGQGQSPFLAYVGGPSDLPSSYTWNVDIDPGDVLELQATGTVGGCNAGALFSWGGTVTIHDQLGEGDDDEDDEDDEDDDDDD